MKKLLFILTLFTSIATCCLAQIQPDANGDFLLTAAAMSAETSNGTFDGSKRNSWSSGTGSWSVNVKNQSTYTVYANFTSGFSTVGITVNTAVNGAVSGTGDWGTYLDRQIGTITFTPGTQTVSMTMTSNAINFAYVKLVRNPDNFTITTSVNNATYGFVAKGPGKPTYNAGDSVRIAAIPYPGYKFTSWANGSIKSDTTVVMAGSITIPKANFALGGAISPNGLGNLTLPASVAALDAQGIAYDGTAITSWQSGKAKWCIELPCATDFVVKGEMSSNNTASGNLNIAFIKGVDTLNLQGTYTNTNAGLSNYAYQDLSALHLEAGIYTVLINRVLELGVSNELNLKTLSLEKTSLGNKKLLTLTSNSATMGKTVANPKKSLYDANEQVTITATPTDGYSFVGWSGDTTSTSASIVVLTYKNKTIKANFKLSGATRYIILANANTAQGSITLNPNQADYASGTKVAITAVPLSGYVFSSWSGALTSTKNPDTLVMNDNKTITANFTAQTIYTLTLNSNTTQGTVSKSPNKANYLSGEKIAITATPLNGYSFIAWTGDFSSTKITDTVTMNGNKTITATFQKDQTSVQSLLANKVNIFPNPFSSAITVQAKDGLIIETVEVVDIAGRICMQPIVVNSESTTLSSELSQLPKGTYFIRVSTRLGKIIYTVHKQ